MPDEDFRTITKRELVNRIADETGQTKVIVRDVLQRFLDSVIDELASGNRLEFRDFGVFEVRERAARIAQNPRTLEKVNVPPKRVVKFKVGRIMRKRVCEELEGDSAVNGNGASAQVPGGSGAGGSGSGGRTSQRPSVTGPPATGSTNGTAAAAEPEVPKPAPPTPPPANPGSPF